MQTMIVLRFILPLLLGVSGFGQTKVIPEFKFSRLSHAGIFTEKNVPSGKQSLFIFFDVTCPHCQEAITDFDKNASRLKEVSIYLVTLDNQPSAKSFLSQYAKNLYEKKNVTVLLDTYNEFITKFQPIQYPSILLYSAKKKLEFYSHEPKDVSKFLVLIKKG